MAGETRSLVSLLQPFVLMCAFREKPQQLPVSNFLLGLALGTYAVTSIIALVALGWPVGKAILAGPLASVILLILGHALLALRGLRVRATQTVTALAGCGTVLNLIALPLALTLEPDEQGRATNSVAALSLLLLTIWSIAVTGHVLRHALSCSMFLALLVALAFSLASEQMLGLFIDVGDFRQ